MNNNQITVVGHYGMSLLMDVKCFPVIGETVEGIGLETEPGGKGYNQAIAASRLGANVNFITAVGDDDFGGNCEKDLILEGVAGRYIMTFKGKKTACAFVINSADKQSEVYVYPGAIRNVTPEYIRKYEAVIRDSSLLLLQNEISSEALCEVVKIAADAGIEIIYNPAPAREMPKEIFKNITCITPNETEAAILAGLDPDKELDTDAALEALHGLGVKNVIITLGSKGSLVSANGQKYLISPLKVPVISTTGAGDAYNAALAVYYLNSHDLLAAAQYASIASGLQVMRPGVVANLPYKAEVDKYFEEYQGKLISYIQ